MKITEYIIRDLQIKNMINIRKSKLIQGYNNKQIIQWRIIKISFRYNLILII